MPRPGRGAARCAVAMATVVAASFVPLDPRRAAAEEMEAAEEKRVSLMLGGSRVFLGRPPVGWEGATFDDSGWAGPLRGPFLARAPTGEPPTTRADGATTLDFVPGGALLIRRTFDFASARDRRRVRVLELQVRYADGFVAFLNGREVARRALGDGAWTGKRPAFPHSAEVERVALALTAPQRAGLKPRGNVLALAIVPAAAGSPVAPVAPAGALDLAAFSGVRIVRGPYLIAPREVKGRVDLSVAWETDLPATGVVTVEGGTAADPSPRAKTRRLASRVRATRHVLRLPRLRHSATVRYRLAASAAPGDGDRKGPFLFQTLPAPPAPARFAVYGDMRAPGHAAHAQVVSALVREAPALVLNTGDLVAWGSEESGWQRYFAITAPLGRIAPVVPALGNHDVARGGLGAAKTWRLFGLPTASPPGGPPGWTSFDLADIHFVILDTSQMGSAAQHRWLDEDLAAVARRAVRPRAIFAFCHEGPWSNGPHGGSELMQRELAPRLAAGGVDVLFSGHDHFYERGEGKTAAGPLTYVVAGGGGAPLYTPTCQPPGAPSAGVPGPLPACPPTVAALVKAYHYIIVEVSTDAITLCPRRPDGSPIEPCTTLSPRR